MTRTVEETPEPHIQAAADRIGAHLETALAAHRAGTTDCRLCSAKGDHRRDDRPADRIVAGLTCHLHCDRDIETAVRYWDEGAATLHGDVWRWDSNGHCVPDDIVTVWHLLGHVTYQQLEATALADGIETSAFLAAYRANQPAEPSAEERAEALAAHGPGVTIVDVVTGRRYTT